MGRWRLNLIEVQRTIKTAEFKKVIGSTKVHVDNKGIN